MTIHWLIISFLLILILTTTSSISIDPLICTNHYSITKPPPDCNNTTICYLQSGFQNLIVNKTVSLSLFVLCLDLPGYTLYVNYTNTTNVYI